MAVRCFLIVVVAGILLAPLVTATKRPIIGILAQETSSTMRETFNISGKASLISASYVKAVEAAGARVVPIFIGQDLQYYKDIISKINGVVFPGGSVEFNATDGYGAAGKFIVDTVLELQKSNVSFPILGVCLGFELLMFLAANGSNDILVPCTAINIALPLVFKEDFRQSNLYGDAPERILEILQYSNVTTNFHRFCVTEERLRQFSLEKTWRVLSTNQDEHGLEFISSSEHVSLPFVGLQFHPEKNIFEWKTTQVNPHTRKAVEISRYFFDWLIAESRTNNQCFASPEEEDQLIIYNYNPVYTGKLNNSFNEQIYFFGI